MSTPEELAEIARVVDLGKLPADLQAAGETEKARNALAIANKIMKDADSRKKK